MFIPRAQVHPNPALYLSPEMVRELALGMDAPYDIAARYDISPPEFDLLQQQPWFGEMVVRQRLELDNHGVMLSAKAKLMLEELIKRNYQQAMLGEISPTQQMDFMKLLKDLAGVGVAAAAAQVGPQFTINISVEGVDQKASTRARHPDLVDVTPTVTMSIPMGETPVPPAPEGMRVPDFAMFGGGGLVGTDAAVNAALAQQAGSR